MILPLTIKRSYGLIFGLFLLMIIIIVFSFTLSPLTVQPVLSGSNAPSQEIGDVIIIDRNIRPSQLKIGDIIVYSPLNVNYHVIHRIIDIKVIDGEYYFLVKGDFNQQPDLREHHPPYQINQLINFTTPDGVTHELVGTWYHQSLVIGRVIITIPKLFWPFMPLFTSQLPPLLHLYLIIMVGIVLYYRHQLTRLQPLLLRARQLSTVRNANGMLNHIKTAFFIIPIGFLFLFVMLTSQTIVFTEMFAIDEKNTTFTSLEDPSPQVITYNHRVELKSNEQIIEVNDTTITISYQQVNETVGRVQITEEGTRTSYDGEATFGVSTLSIFSNHTYLIDLRSLLLTGTELGSPLHLQLFPYLAKFPSLGGSEKDVKEIAILGFIVPIQEHSTLSEERNESILMGKDQLSFVQDMLAQHYSLEAKIDAKSGLVLELKIGLSATLYIPPLALDFLAFTFVPLLLVTVNKKRFERETLEKIKILKEIDEIARELRTKKDQDLEENPN